MGIINTRSHFLRRDTLTAVFSVFMLFAVSCNRSDAVSSATVMDDSWQKNPVAVDALVVSSGRLADSIHASGTVAGVNEARVVSDTSGIVVFSEFRLGEEVEKGQILLSVDSSLLKLDMERAYAHYEVARIEAASAERLLESGGTSAVGLAKARSAETAAKVQYEQAKKRYGDSSARAPIQGVIAYRDPSATIGNTIVPGTKIARIVDTSAFTLVAGVGEREVGLVSQGDKAFVRIPAALGEEVIDAEVRAIGASSDMMTGSFPLLVGFTNTFGDRIKSGMSATVTVPLHGGNDVIIIPGLALVRRGERYIVFVASGGTAAVREIVPGRRIGPKVEVLSGLENTDVLVISALSRLRDGSPVTVHMRGSSADWE